MIQLTLTLKMTTAQVVERSVTVNNNSPIQDYVHPDDQIQPFDFLLSFPRNITHTVFLFSILADEDVLLDEVVFSRLDQL